MAADDPTPDPASDLTGALSDLGRRIDAAKAEADTRGQAPPPRRFPMAWVAVALLIALVSGGLILSSGGDDGDELAAGGSASSSTLPVATTPSSTGSTTAEEAGDTGAGAGTETTAASLPTTTAAPTTTEAPTTTAAPTTTEAPTTTAAPTTTRPPTTTTVTTAPPTTTPTTPAPPADDGPNQTVTPPSAPGPSPGEVTVVDGDSFWTIAEQQLGSQLGRAPTTAETTSYWAQLLQLNGDRLVHPGNPNLIYPGQVLVLPGTG